MSTDFDQERAARLSRFIGKTIKAAEAIEDGKFVRLTFEDGTACTIEGSGYDGLWDDVYVYWTEPKDGGRVHP